MRLISKAARLNRNSESGNVFLAIFGAVALVGLLGASVMTFMKGPLSTSVKLTKINTAETQMAMGAQVAVMATVSQANNGDCETTPDGTVEPMPWRTPTTEPVPTGGGLVPLSLGISKKDPWGTEYGYCVWNHGSTTSGAGCDANMLAGTGGAGYTAYPVVALVSAGPDKMFTTTCRSFAAADVNSDGDLQDAADLPMVSKAVETDDDIITSFTYNEATGISGGLWSLKAGDPTKATIGKDIETTGRAEFKGGLLLPDKSLVDCNDISNAGVMAKNGTTGIEICDGAGTWTAITGGGVTGNNLVLTPNVSSGMNVTGGCGTPTCYSSNVTFTLTNKAATASPVLTTSLSNTANFEFVSNGCTGVSVAPNADCQMVVRAKASGNVSYAGTLQVIGGNSPLATLDGVGSGFAGCNAGGMGPGGYYVACNVSGSYNLVITPSGCTGGMTNPTCAGGADTVTFAAPLGGGAAGGPPIGAATSNGAQNTANLIGYSGGVNDFPAVNYCNGLVYGGYDDWFLPSIPELAYFYTNKATVGAASTGFYWGSTENNTASQWQYMNIATGGNSGTWSSTANLVRCMRRDPAATVSAIVDNTPNTVVFDTKTSTVASSTVISNTVSIYGVTRPVNVSISGGTNAKFSINGAAYTTTPATVTNGDTITLQATTPLAGVQEAVNLSVGTLSPTWTVRTVGNNSIRVFTTNATTQGNFNASTMCNNAVAAAGLQGTWAPIISLSAGSNIKDVIPWNWVSMKNMRGNVVATSIDDYVDGTISAPMNFNEFGNSVTGLIWSGFTNAGVGGTPNSSARCSGGPIWGSSSSGVGGFVGDPSATTGGLYMNNGSTYYDAICSNGHRLLCIETNANGVDLDPNEVSISPAVTFVSGGIGTSNTITILGVTDAVAVSITPTAGIANIIKNGASVAATSTTAGLNETLAFTLTAPTTLGTKNTATISIGPDTYSWWVGYADSAKEAKVFVTSGLTTQVFGGLAGADSMCEYYAANSPYGLSSKWKAMISDSNISMKDRIAWNWGTLKTVTGTVIVDGGYPDLLDGTLDLPINVTDTGDAYSGWVHTGSDRFGTKYNAAGSTASSYWYNDWTSTADGCGNGAVGGSSTSASTHFYQGTSCYTQGRIYCIEEIDTTNDTTPNIFTTPYAIQVGASSCQTSAAVIIGGMSTGATTTLSVSATGGTPTFKLNGGAEVTSATVRNGDSVVFLMDAPATTNSSNKMTITAGTMTSYWRVWTGDTTGSIVKRVFINYANNFSGGHGSRGAYDPICQAKASSAGLGGTWKAILSGTAESEWAVNTIGYNWTTLRLVDGTTDVAATGTLWASTTTSASTLINAIRKSETGADVNFSGVYTNTDQYGFAMDKFGTRSDINSCQNWAYGGTSGYAAAGTSTAYTNSSWIYNSNNSVNCYGAGNWRAIYCIEQ